MALFGVLLENALRLLVFFLWTVFNASSLFALTAFYTSSVQSGCVPLVVDFTDASLGVPVNWTYTFGDGGSSTSQNPRYTFTKAGTFRVALEVFDGSSYSTYFTYIVVKKLPHADFTSIVKEACPNTPIQFINKTSLGDTGILSSSWDFGDGQVVSNNGDVSKTYQKDGNYNVKLTVRDKNNCQHIITKNQYIKINPNPVPAFSFQAKYSCSAPQRVNFYNNSANSVQYQWDFDDGNTDNGANPVHFYNTAKNYTVSLTASSDKGCKSKISKSIPVSFGKVKADFSADAYSGCIPFSLKLNNNSLPVNGTYDCIWDFGDGSKSTASTPSKSFPKTGTFHVKLIVKGNQADCIDSISKTFTISDKPKSTISVSDTLACQGKLQTTFKAPSANINKYLWFIEGQNIETKTDSLPYIFKNPGIYQVQVLLIDQVGCQSSYQFQRIIVQNLLSGYTFGEEGGCRPYTPKIKDTSHSFLPSPLIYTWTDGQAASYYSQNPKITYQKTGNYNLKLVLRDQFGCVDEASGPVKVGYKVKPGFRISKNRLCINEPIEMFNTTKDSLLKLVESWKWVFGNLESYHPNYFKAGIRETPGFQTAMLISTINACKDSTQKKDSIEILPAYARFDFYFDTCYSHVGRLINSNIDADLFEWRFPNGSSSKDSIIYYPFKKSGSTNISMIAKNSQTGCSDSVTMGISPPGDISGIVAEPLNNCTPQTFAIKNASNNARNSFWELGNGDTLSENKPFEYTYTEPGNYIIKQTAYDYLGCPYYSSTPITVNGPPVKSEVWPKKGCLPLQITLSDSIPRKNIKKIYWKLEDDPQWIIATELKTPIVYTIKNMPLSGDSIFHAEIMVEDSAGCVSVRTFKIRTSGPRLNPVYSSSLTCDANTFTFKSNLDSISASFPIKYRWVLGDGQFKTLPEFSYIYEKGGHYQVELQVTDGLGCFNKTQFSISSSDPALLAKFNTNEVEAICPPLISKFNNLSLSDPNNKIVSYHWDFGDGTYSSLESPSKIYVYPGNYDVSLTVYNQFGCHNTTKIPEFIKVGGPIAIHKINQNSTCLGNRIQFSSLSNPNTVSEWDFGDGNTEIGKQINYRYSKAGTYYPKLLLKDNNGCKSVLLPPDSIVILPKPDARFTYSNPCLSQLLTLNNLSVSNSANKTFKSQWQVNNTIDSNTFPHFVFSEQGDKNILLLVENEFKCRDSLVKRIHINKPQVNFNIQKNKYCLGQPLQFEDHSVSARPLLRRIFLLNGLETDLNNLYLQKGNNSFSYIMEDSSNCKDTLEYAGLLKGIDTLAALPVQIVKLSHMNNTELELLIDPSADEDFESYQLYQAVGNTWELVQRIKQVDSTHQILRVPANQSFCFAVSQLNSCHAESAPGRAHCNMNLSVRPGSNLNHLNWNKYSGWPVNTYRVKRLEMNSNTFETIANLDGETNSYTDSHVVCHRIHAYQIEALSENNTQMSLSDTAESKAIWVNQLPSPSLNLVTVVEDTSILIQWDPKMQYQKSLITGNLISVSSNENTRKYRIHADSNRFLNPQVRVDLLKYDFTVQYLDNCQDSSRASTEASNIHLRAYAIDNNGAPGLIWNSYHINNSSALYYTVQRMDAHSIFQDLTTTTDTFFIDKGNEKNCMKAYTYRIIAHMDLGQKYSSLSNVIRIRPKSSLFAPNAFSPNNNQINDVFLPNGQYIYDYHLEVFNRWGEKVFQSTHCFEGWDGTYAENLGDESIFYYRLSATGTDGQYHVLKGSITLLR